MARLHRRLLTLGVMVVAVAAGQIVYGVDDLLRGRVTSYSASATCLVTITGDRCTAVGRRLDPSVFRVSVERQRVESLAENGEAIFVPLLCGQVQGGLALPFIGWFLRVRLQRWSALAPHSGRGRS